MRLKVLFLSITAKINQIKEKTIGKSSSKDQKLPNFGVASVYFKT